MTDLIKVPYTELLYRASRIRQEAEAVRAELRLLNETVDSLQWMGKRAEKFFSLWERTKPEMEQWVLTLESFALSLEAQARQMQAADEGF